MFKMGRMVAVAAGIVTLSGCAIMGSAPPPGVLYTGAKGVGPATSAVVTDGVRPGPKSGKACAMGVLGLASWGDMSLEQAKKNAGITRVDTVDYETMSILGVVYAKNCTMVTGE